MTFSILTGSITEFTGSFQVPDDGHDIDADSVGRGFEALADRTAFLSSSLYDISSALDTRITTVSNSIDSTILGLQAIQRKTAMASLEATGSAPINSIRAVIQSPDRDELVIIAGITSLTEEVYRSQDFGQTWVDKSFDTNLTYDLMYSHNVGFIAGGQVGSYYISHDSGITWLSKSMDGAHGNIRGLATNHSASAAVGTSGYMAENLDLAGSSSWVSKTAAASYGGNFSAVEWANGYFIAVGSNGEIQRWQPDGSPAAISAGGYTDVFNDIAANGSNVMIVGDTSKVMFSSDSGASFADRSPTNIGSRDINAVGYHGGYDIWVFTADDGLLGVSNDNGQNWEITPIPDYNSTVLSIYLSSSNTHGHYAGSSTFYRRTFLP